MSDDSLVAYLESVPASGSRPRPMKRARHSLGGKIYLDSKGKRVRLYLRSGDKRDQSWSVDPNDKEKVKRLWNIACAGIETDPRPGA